MEANEHEHDAEARPCDKWYSVDEGVHKLYIGTFGIHQSEFKHVTKTRSINRAEA
jgi:hypothetical protein